MPSQLINPVGGQFGYPHTRDADRVAFLNADATPIPIGNIVAYNATGDAVNSTTATNPLLAIGIAYETIPVNKAGLVVVKGLALANIGSVAVAAAALLNQSTAAGNNGLLATAAAPTIGQVIAIALAAYAVNAALQLVEVGKM